MPWLRKQSMQLASKMRFLSAQLVALLEDGLWRRNAAHANAMAARLAAAVTDVPGVEITHPVEANGVFAVLPPGVADRVRASWRFYTWDEQTGEVRWLCSWDTTPRTSTPSPPTSARPWARRRDGCSTRPARRAAGQGPAGYRPLSAVTAIPDPPRIELVAPLASLRKPPLTEAPFCSPCSGSRRSRPCMTGSRCCWRHRTPRRSPRWPCCRRPSPTTPGRRTS